MDSTSNNSPSLPWKTRLSISVTSFFGDLATRPDGTVNRRFSNLFDIKSSPNPNKPIRGVLSSDILVDSSRDLSVRVFIPSSVAVTTALPIIVFFHGGGFALLSNTSFVYDNVCRRFARRIPAVVVSVDYRRTPEHRFPSQYDDGYDVLRFLDRNNTGSLPPNADVSRCFLAGDSAGANLGHHVAVRFCRQKSKFKSLNVIGLISIQPFFGGEERTESEIRLDPGYIVSLARTDWLWKAFLPRGMNRDHFAVNVSGPNAEDISEMEFPETVVFVGGFDPLSDRQRRYYEWLKEMGKKVEMIEFPNMIHAFYLFPELSDSSLLINQVKAFVSKCVKSKFLIQ